MSHKLLPYGISLVLVVGTFSMADARTIGKTPPPSPPVVIAIVEPSGFNVLHEDFGLAPGQSAAEVPATLKPRIVTLPRSGSFDRRKAEVSAGPLGHLEPGTFYSVKGTRVVGIYVSESATVTDVYASPDHGTGSASAALGLTHGTFPLASLVYVPDTSADAWRWLAEQRWIDVISASYGGISSERCEINDIITEISEQGRLVFTAVGNGEQIGTVAVPSGAPAAYQVGGVTADGNTYVDPAQPASRTPNRPYETGDRYMFEAADSESLRGSVPFGGTSGAAPSTAGRAAAVIDAARRMLGARGLPPPGSLASGRHRVSNRGPLADRGLTGQEVTALLHQVARPTLPSFPQRYLIEGFGALDAGTTAEAIKILSGAEVPPDRVEDEAAHEHVESARAVAFGFCG